MKSTPGHFWKWEKKKTPIKGVSQVLWLANSIHNWKVVGSNLVSSKILDGNEIKAMPGSIPAPKFGSIENTKNTGGQMKHTKNI